MNKTLHRALDLFYRTACLEKNYRLQDIQLSKSSLSYRVMPLLQARRVRENSCSFSRVANDRGHSNNPKRSGAPPAYQTGGEYRARTGDLLVANQALSQLS